MDQGTLSSHWVMLAGLGAFHGLNPAMGWLFAVALGMQERRRGAVLRALLPLGLGHALAVAAAVAVAVLLGIAVSVELLRWPVAALLVGLGASRLWRHRHPRWAAMRVGLGRLTLWSFLMASAHGAGLMVVPILLGMAVASHAAGHHHGPASMTTSDALVATTVHGLAYLLATAAVAVLVFEKLGLGVLRRAWVNLDLIWAAALIASGALSLAL